MGTVLFLAHRFPYPPNKGDKVRSFHLLKHLRMHHKVFLGTFIDDPDDLQYVPKLESLCDGLYAPVISPSFCKLKSLAGLLLSEALSVTYYRHAGMSAWVQNVLETSNIDAVVVFSSQMVQYAPRNVPLLVDFVDVDSAKWGQYALARRWPLSWLYRREAEMLLEFERESALRARHSFFVTPNEVSLFNGVAPESILNVSALKNGVDADFFAPDPNCNSPFLADEMAVVFTGAMDYWPNIDGVIWFVEEIWPRLKREWPTARFYIVGRSPTSQVLALAGESVVVTGTVNDVRPYLQHAAAVVAPLRVARGIQNKILEAMAMARPVVTVPSCAEAIGVPPPEGVIQALTPDDFVIAIGELLRSPTQTSAVGQLARQCVVEGYSWHAHLSGIDRFLPPETVERRL